MIVVKTGNVFVKCNHEVNVLTVPHFIVTVFAGLNYATQSMVSYLDFNCFSTGNKPPTKYNLIPLDNLSFIEALIVALSSHYSFTSFVRAPHKRPNANGCRLWLSLVVVACLNEPALQGALYANPRRDGQWKLKYYPQFNLPIK